MPAVPEIRRIQSQIGLVEVLGQPDTKYPRHTEGDIAVSRKVKIQQDAENIK